mgnify:CR=1 FL=1
MFQKRRFTIDTCNILHVKSVQDTAGNTIAVSLRFKIKKKFDIQVFSVVKP